MASLKITNLYKRYGSVEILKDINLQISRVSHCVRGPLRMRQVDAFLRAISGLEEISEGTMEIDGRVVNDVAPSARGIAMVFQSYAKNLSV